MNRSYCLSNARIVLKDQILENGSLLIENGIISAINPAYVPEAENIDLQGGIVIPGLIDLHCDALEKEVEPRPKVHFPLNFACAQADKRNASNGITTVFHAISFANDEFGVRNNAFASSIVHEMRKWNASALVDNRIHCRYEVTDPTALNYLLELIERDAIDLVSIMDHSPGQGQFKDVAAFKDYLARSYKKTEAELDELIANKLAQSEGTMDRIRTLIEKAAARNIAIASHDDDTADKVHLLHGLGVKISEFPINLEAAQAAKAKGISTIFGAPNILRGKSQSGSMRALDAVVANVADCLCSDYHPASLLTAAFRLPEISSISLPEAIRLVTYNPAQAAGLADRGEIAIGKRADLVCVSNIQEQVQAQYVFSAGKPVYQAEFCYA
ncbi:alpha-D-ribose 1-methylphosphonate 5-triphosphate diphosphatase [Acinetobacter sp. ANC 3813]|uniref:alpha-D-ribose 1-methylphosphonate 5-triphosphate diphosphatase n=1 Tax=Acinetobacter sp. ANC 3813 TaxID=1977873 RepID=UPI000A34B4BF|nr:alpha-D-ribose 1-methylphosphonate 5-triphosphate diphosphatase [Acinetobacter sp. ANC 3813]OTG88533.1 alpha-D-ribose 1-methylphosphonate 5-triphosphate diphosphatase [Acinetobacter sp. ANC 3813]